MSRLTMRKWALLPATWENLTVECSMHTPSKCGPRMLGLVAMCTWAGRSVVSLCKPWPLSKPVGDSDFWILKPLQPRDVTLTVLQSRCYLGRNHSSGFVAAKPVTCTVFTSGCLSPSVIKGSTSCWPQSSAGAAWTCAHLVEEARAFVGWICIW